MLKRREDYTPPVFLVNLVDLNIDIYDHQTIVTTRLTIAPNPNSIASTILKLDGRSLRLLSVSVDGVQLGNDAFKLDLDASIDSNSDGIPD